MIWIAKWYATLFCGDDSGLSLCLILWSSGDGDISVCLCASGKWQTNLWWWCGFQVKRTTLDTGDDDEMSVAPIWSLFAVSDRASAVISKFRTAANAVLMVLQCLLMSAQTFCNFEETEIAMATAASAEHPFFTRSAVRRDSAKKDAYLIKDCSQCRLFYMSAFFIYCCWDIVSTVCTSVLSAPVRAPFPAKTTAAKQLWLHYHHHRLCLFHLTVCCRQQQQLPSQTLTMNDFVCFKCC